MRASMDRHDNFNPMEVHVSMDGQTRFNSIETSASIGWKQRLLLFVAYTSIPDTFLPYSTSMIAVRNNYIII